MELKNERELFEGAFKMPGHTVWTGTGYAATSYNAWAANEFCERWRGWKARADLVALAAGAPAETAKPERDMKRLMANLGNPEYVAHYAGALWRMIDEGDVLIEAAQAAPVQPAPQAVADIGYELMQDDMCVAGTSGKGALAEIQRYAAVYGQDGPVEIVEVTRRVLTPDAGMGG